MCAQSLSCIQLFVTLWTVARQAPLSMEFSRQEYWSRLPFPPPGDLRDPKIEPTSPVSPALQADTLLLNHQGSPKVHHLSLSGSLLISRSFSTVCVSLTSFSVWFKSDCHLHSEGRQGTFLFVCLFTLVTQALITVAGM